MSFNKAAEALTAAKDLKLSNDEQLAFYGLYKQANIGDNNTSKPGFYDPKGKYKWEAWNKVKGKSK
jgi:diazepam-binding inhibitor (GABA receptor modulating acyl-CoA-binding protein)